MANFFDNNVVTVHDLPGVEKKEGLRHSADRPSYFKTLYWAY